MQDQQASVSIAAELAEMSEREFVDWLEQRQRAQNHLLDAVKTGVTNGLYSPLLAGRIAACVSGDVFGFDELHGTPVSEQIETITRAREITNT